MCFGARPSIDMGSEALSARGEEFALTKAGGFSIVRPSSGDSGSTDECARICQLGIFRSGATDSLHLKTEWRRSNCALNRKFADSRWVRWFRSFQPRDGGWVFRAGRCFWILSNRPWRCSGQRSGSGGIVPGANIPRRTSPWAACEGIQNLVHARFGRRVWVSKSWRNGRIEHSFTSATMFRNQRGEKPLINLFSAARP